MKKITLLCMLAMMIFVLQAQNEKLRIAVFDPTSSGTSVDEGTKIAVREIISSTFVNTGKYSIVERSLLQQVMKEQKFSNSDVVDEGQATELGRLAGANKVALSVITLVGGRNMLSIKLIDVKTATVELQKTRIVNSNDLLDVVEPLTLELMGEKTNQTVITNSPKPAIPDNKPISVPQINYGITVFEDLKLMVINKDLGGSNWSEAVNKCKGLEMGGFKDWYLPSKYELQMIFEHKGNNQKANVTGNVPFGNTLSGGCYWSSTEVNDKIANNVFASGWITTEHKKDKRPKCLCVRKINENN